MPIPNPEWKLEFTIAKGSTLVYTPAPKGQRLAYIKKIASRPSKQHLLTDECFHKGLITEERKLRLIAMFRLQRRLRSSKQRLRQHRRHYQEKK